MKIALVPLNPTIGDISGNTEKILFFIDKAIQKKCELIIFPELAILGYPPKDYLFYPLLREQHSNSLIKFKRKSKKISIIVGGISVNKSQGRPLKNTAYIFQNGQQYLYSKQLLPNYDVFDECRYFEPGNEILKLKISGKNFGITICEDTWYQEEKLKTRYHHNPLAEYANLPIDYLINISASPFEVDKPKRRHKQLSSLSKQLGCYIIYVNQSGANDDLIFDGTAFVYDSNGSLIYQSPDFEENFFVYDTSEEQKRITPNRDELSSIQEALILGIRDYVRKSGFKKVLLGLSGGIDSALVAVLAQEAVGSDNILGVMMPSRHSSSGSLVDAEKLAKNLNIKTQKIEIEAIHSVYESIFNKTFEPNGPNDLTNQNIQARIRGNLLMAISNNENRLLLNTTNKSEMAMGYGTLYGDMCGAIAVISDLTKTYVYKLCQHINREEEIIPQNIIDKEPSAELRPNQKDTDSLPPYDILDPILDKMIEGRELTGGPSNTPKKLVQSIMRNEYKRFQAPIGLKVMGKAFGSGRRMPIVGKINV